MLSARLQLLESRLQRLFEEQLARLLPGEASRAMLREQLMHSLQTALRRSGGKPPQRLSITLSPQFGEAYQRNPVLQAAVERSVLQAIRESGLEWDAPPKIEVLTDATLPDDDLRLELPGTAPLEETEAMPTLSPPAGPHPKVAAGGAFLIVGGKETYLITAPIVNIGRRPDNDLVVNDPRVSRRHAQLRAQGGQYFLFDLNATGGTFVNGRRIHQQQLRAGDVISLAGYPLVFGIESPAAPDETQEYTLPSAA